MKRRLPGGGRACDSCHDLHARWYCAADDAFLCKSCDVTVHSANPMARLHHRLRLQKTISVAAAIAVPAWQQGVKRKPRTPRPHHNSKHQSPVPDLESSAEPEELESQLLYRVPVFDPGLYSPSSPNPASLCNSRSNAANVNVSAETTFTPTETDLAEFAADMECLLAPVAEPDSFCIGELGLLNSTEQEMKLEQCEFADCKTEKIVGLRLDYEAVIAEWSAQGSSAWTHCEQPEMGSWMGGGVWNGGAGFDGGREARVSRYREKRRTRLFAKKIRYEVRKLNAEKRPRMKGRFVKRPVEQT